MQAFFVGNAKGLHLGLGHRVLLPRLFPHLVSPDVDELAGEEGKHLVQHVLHEVDGGIVNVIHVVVVPKKLGVAPGRRDLFAIAQLGVSNDRRVRVPRQLDLGNHRDESIRSIFDHLANLILGVVAARLGISWLHVRWLHMVVIQFRSQLCEFGIPLDLNSPTVVIHQVPVEHVELVECHGVQELQHKALGHKVTRDIHVHAAPRESWRVLDLNARDFPLRASHLGAAKAGRRKKLAKSLDPVEHTLGPRCADLNMIRLDDDSITLGAEAGERIIQLQLDGSFS